MVTFWRTFCSWKDAGDLEWEPRGGRSEATEDKTANFALCVEERAGYSKRALNFGPCRISRIALENTICWQHWNVRTVLS